MSPPAPLGRIHLVADLEVLATLADATERVRALLEAGLPSLTLRGPGRPVEELLARGAPLRGHARRLGALFLVNGPLEVVERLDADGWHLPASAPPPSPDFLRPWGRSVHDAGGIAGAVGPSWLFLSPVFPTESKPGAAGLGAGRFAELVAAADAPVYALGGVHSGNAAECLAAGAAGVAAIRGLLADDGPDWVRLAR